MDNLPYTRFKEDRTTASALRTWLQTHNYIWYKAPMDIDPRRCYLTSKVKTWKRSPDRFSFGVEVNAGFDGMLRFRVDETHLDRIMIPNAQWHHGISATVTHTFRIGPYSNVITEDSRGSLKRRNVPIIGTEFTVHQSNGYHLPHRTLEHAINFCKRQNMELRAFYGRRQRVLVRAMPMSGEVAR